MRRWTIKLLIAAVLVMSAAASAQPASEPSPQPANGKLKVFVLAGQSNMVGFGTVPGEAGDAGTMAGCVAADPEQYGHLVDAEGTPVVRDDVWIVDLSYAGKERQGWLTVGYGASADHIGPEYGFGFAVGDHFEDPVLIIKCAWGGRSLVHNFLPPSAAEYEEPTEDGDMGFQYAEVVRIVQEVTANLDTYFPEYAGEGYEVVGFGWHQGWNDRINADAVNTYEDNMAHFIRDMRADLGVDGLPFVIANTGMGGWGIPETAHYKARVERLMEDQLDLADPEEHPAFAGTVAGVETRDFWRPHDESPSNQEYHWNRNWETYYLIGTAMGEAILELLAD